MPWSQRPRATKKAGSISGSLLGILVFLGGVCLLLFTFKLAYDLFMVPPQDALGIKPKQPIDLGLAGQSFIGVLIKILMLVVMGLMGSLIANRGVALFTGSRVPHKTKVVSVPESEVQS
ncbi:MAG TPA: hypothetical protein VJ835_11115 [Fimbriimonadaceae bacterium]|nr:hypothetical protein [Fimbriimonadaceae bacterium]